jgi:hypothetical protein
VKLPILTLYVIIASLLSQRLFNDVIPACLFNCLCPCPHLLNSTCLALPYCFNAFLVSFYPLLIISLAFHNSVAIATLQHQDNYLKTSLGSDSELNVTQKGETTIVGKGQEGHTQITMVASRQDSNAEVTFAEVTSAKPPLRTQPADAVRYGDQIRLCLISGRLT